MKKITLFALAVLLLVFSGCKKETKDLATLLIGDWQLSAYEQPVSKSITIGDEKIDVFVSFVALDFGFYLRQSIGEGYLKTFSGSWTLAGNTLSGKYLDGAPWGSTYTIDILENDTLYMTSVETSEKYTYTRVQ